MTLRETDDEDADRDRLERMLATLRDFPGDDEVRLTIETPDGGSHSAVLGKVRVRVCPELTSLLTDLLAAAGSVEAVGVA